MKLSLKTSGGFANIEIRGRLDTNDLTPDLAEKAERLLNRESLEAAASEAVSPEVVDSMLYEVTIEGAGDEPPETFLLDDSAVDPELAEALSQLMSEIVRQRVEGGGEEE